MIDESDDKNDPESIYLLSFCWDSSTLAACAYDLTYTYLIVSN